MWVQLIEQPFVFSMVLPWNAVKPPWAKHPWKEKKCSAQRSVRFKGLASLVWRTYTDQQQVFGVGNVQLMEVAGYGCMTVHAWLCLKLKVLWVHFNDCIRPIMVLYRKPFLNLWSHVSCHINNTMLCCSSAMNIPTARLRCLLTELTKLKLFKNSLKIKKGWQNYLVNQLW